MGNGGRRIANSENFLDQRAGGRHADRKVKVLFVGGYGRSGSTLLGRMLGQIPRWFYVGELRFLWRGGLVKNEPCGCGVPFRDCSFWQQVGQEAFGGWDKVNLQEISVLTRTIGNRSVPTLLVPNLSRRFEAGLGRYAGVLDRLYRAIQLVSGASVIVDSTKKPSYALLLRRVPAVDLRVVHLVRDSRGVAFSWMKTVVQHKVEGRDQYMPSYSAVRTGVRWVGCNAFFHMLPHIGILTIRVRYETLVRFPWRETNRIVEFTGEEIGGDGLDSLRRGEVRLSYHHTVAGNPMRFSHGTMPLRLDEDWRVKMPRGQRYMATFLTWPLLLRYGYFGDGLPPKEASEF